MYIFDNLIFVFSRSFSGGFWGHTGSPGANPEILANFCRNFPYARDWVQMARARGVRLHLQRCARSDSVMCAHHSFLGVSNAGSHARHVFRGGVRVLCHKPLVRKRPSREGHMKEMLCLYFVLARDPAHAPIPLPRGCLSSMGS